MKKKVNILHIRTCKDTNLLSDLRKVVRYDSHLTHINGWFDFCSTLGYDWTSKMKKAAVAVMMIVMCIGGSQTWGQTDKHGKANCNAAQAVLEVWDLQNASISATPVERTSPNGEKIYGAYDINVYKDGREWQPAPEQPALVSMTDPGFVDGKMYDVYHEGKDGLEFVATVKPENGKITFPAHSFSVYIVAEAGNYARLKVTFHRADNSTVTIYVKPADLDQGFFDRIVYNPGVGTVPSGMQFRGWIANASYSVSDVSDGLTFEGVRDAIRTRLGSTVNDGDEMHFYAMLFKSYTVSYLDERGVVLATSEIAFPVSEGTPSKSYTVNAAYTPPDNSQKFEGWKVLTGGSNIAGHVANQLYTNGTGITIRGDVVFYDTVSEGHWLIYHENGKGATYKAADFVNAGAVTVRPADPTRNGYTFDDWYLGAPATEGGDPTGSRFNFGNTLNANTHIYAKWTPKRDADYTIIIWKQNVEGDGYDFDTAITLEGRVGNTINTVSSQGNGNGRYARIRIGNRNYDFSEENITGHDYTGFHLDSFDQNVRIVTEGNAVLNVYYVRNQHTLRFQVEGYSYTVSYSTSSGNYYIPDGNGGYTRVYLYRNNNRWWRDRSLSWGGWSYSNEYTGQIYTRDYGWQDIKVITALYGQSIGGNFPIVDTNGVTYNNGERWDPQSTPNDANDVIVYIDVMPDNDETYRLNVADREKKTLHYYVEALPGATGTVSAPNTLYDYNGNTVSSGGRQFVEYKTIEARYRWATKEQDFFEIIGYHRLGSDKVEAYIDRDNNGYCYSNPDAECTLSFYYTRDNYSITFMDGAYYNGNNQRLTSITSEGRLELVSNIAYRANISSYNNHTPASTPEGFVFEGWYADKACTRPYTFDRMPKGGVTVFAKWRQIQYRVFLHPNAGTDPSLDWGSDDQEMNFRVAYRTTVSSPTGIREDYEFAGWFTDSDCTDPFNADAVLLDETNTSYYDKTVDFTDPMDKWGNGATTNNDVDRFWITKKFDLYGKWRAKLRGADGITVEYDCNGGSTSSTATYQYQDNVHAVARDACTPSDATKEFSHWVLQNYNTTTNAYEDIPGSRIYPGARFTVLKANSKVDNARWCAPGSTTNCESTEPGDLTPPDNHPDYTEYHADYTVKLRAEYVVIEKPTYTFIVWYKNDGNGGIVRTDGTGRDNPSLGINVTDPPTPSIPDAPTRAGYTFKGWYKKNITGSTIPDTVKQCTPNFLYYNSEDDKYYKEAGFSNEVSKVAADIYQPDDYLYAIWEPVVDFNLSAVCRGVQMTLPTTTTGGVTLTGEWTATAGTVSGDSYTPPDSGDATLTFTPRSSSYPSSCASAKSFPITVNQLDATIVIGN